MENAERFQRAAQGEVSSGHRLGDPGDCLDGGGDRTVNRTPLRIFAHAVRSLDNRKRGPKMPSSFICCFVP